MLELLEYLVLGIGVGTVGALLGLGGGFILVPIFMLFMIAPHGSTFTTVQQVVPELRFTCSPHGRREGARGVLRAQTNADAWQELYFSPKRWRFSFYPHGQVPDF